MDTNQKKQFPARGAKLANNLNGAGYRVVEHWAVRQSGS